jgi:nucleoside-triphosphatase THEP1
VIVIDEVGPMELYSHKFRQATVKAVEGSKLVMGVVHWKATDSLITEIRGRDDVEVHLVTMESREDLHLLVLKEALGFLSDLLENKTL